MGFTNYIRIDYATMWTYYDRIIMNYIIAASGSLCVICLCHVFVRYCPKSIIRIGQFTLGIYTLQTILLDNTFQDLIKNDLDNWVLLNIVVSPLLSLIIMVICVWTIKTISKNKNLDLVFFGGAYYQKENPITNRRK